MNNSASPPPQPAPTAPSPTVPSTADSNIFFTYEEAVKLFPGVAKTIAVERKTGTPAQWMIFDQPRTANDLYALVKKLHGRNPETTYEIAFRDGVGHGSVGLVSMPSTMDDPAAAPAAGQPLPSYPHPSPSHAQPQPTPVVVTAPPTDTVATMQEMFKLFQQMQGAAQPPPAAQPQPPPVDPTTSVQRMFELFRQMQGAAQPPQPQQSQQPVVMPTPPPQGSDPAVMMAWMQQVFQMFQQMQASATPPAPPPAQPPPAAPPTDPVAMMKEVFKLFQQVQPPQPAPQSPQPQSLGGVPPVQPPPGMMYVPGFGFVPVEALFKALGGGPATPSAASPYRPRYPGADPREPGAPPYDPRHPYQPPPPQRPQTPSEQLREAASAMRSTFEVVREFQEFVGSPAAEPPPPEEDDSPVRVIDMGPAKGVINRSDGTLRGFETTMANLPSILKWWGEQRAEIRKAKEEKEEEERRRQQQQLPPGYVVAGPDYVPPEGFVAVPVDRIPPQAHQAQPAQAPLPEPPEDMPPPITPPAAAPPRRAWGMPTMPRRE
jgi:hypothetical protein